MTRTRQTIVLALTAALILVACGSNDGGGAASPSPTAGGTAIEISGLAYKPDVLEVAAGAEVVWTNHDSTRHTVTAGTPDAPDTSFDAALDEEGVEFRQTFEAAGAYAFFCRVHPNGMQGEIRVG
ncbi:MAG: plastocyanin/azurin family copper-binding protein [Actinomycetota bacterium]